MQVSAQQYVINRGAIVKKKTKTRVSRTRRLEELWVLCALIITEDTLLTK